MGKTWLGRYKTLPNCSHSKLLAWLDFLLRAFFCLTFMILWYILWSSVQVKRFSDWKQSIYQSVLYRLHISISCLMLNILSLKLMFVGVLIWLISDQMTGGEDLRVTPCCSSHFLLDRSLTTTWLLYVTQCLTAINNLFHLKTNSHWTSSEEKWR